MLLFDIIITIIIPYIISIIILFVLLLLRKLLKHLQIYWKFSCATFFRSKNSCTVKKHLPI